MKKVKSFFHIFKNSLIPTSNYYHKIIRTPLKFSFKYFITLIFLLTLFLFLVLGKNFNPKKILTILNSLNLSLENYPSDLTIYIDNGTALSNYNHPYFFWLDNQNKKTLLFVFDETAELSKIKTYKSFILMNSKNLVFNLNQIGLDKNFYIQPLNQLPNQKFGKDQVLQINNLLKKIIKNYPLIYLSLGFSIFALIFIFTTFFTLFYLLLSTIIVFIAWRFFLKKKFHLKKIFQISLHTATFPLILDYLLFVSIPAVNLGISPQLAKALFPVSFLILLSVFTFTGVYHAHFEKSKKP
ncbi:MAG: hypothetical protein ACK4FL_01165 [Microgenomates group bacterium]